MSCHKSIDVDFIIGTLANGGAERIVSNIVNYLPDNIHKRVILFGEEAKEDYSCNSEIIYLDRERNQGIIKKLSLFLKRASIIKEHKKNNPTLRTISFLEYPNILNLYSYRNGKTIISVRNHMSTKHKGLKGLMWKFSIRFAYKKADLIIAISKGVKLDLVKNFSINSDLIKVIYNPLDTELIKQMADESINYEYSKIFKNPVIITTGRLTDQKGQWHLIRALKKVKSKIPDAKLVILGKGNLKIYLESLAKGLGLADDVFLLGFQDNPFKFIKNSSVFVFPSLYEGFGNVLIEAMACGIPVISSDCPSGPREIIAPDENIEGRIEYNIDKNRYGILVPVCDGCKYSAEVPLAPNEEFLADRIIEILENKELHQYFSDRSKCRSQDFSIGTLIREWEDIILNLPNS